MIMKSTRVSSIFLSIKHFLLDIRCHAAFSDLVSVLVVFKHISEKWINMSTTLKKKKHAGLRFLGYYSFIIHVFVYSCFRKVTPFSIKFWRGCPSVFQFCDWTQHHHNVCASAKLVAHPKWVENKLNENIRITLNNSITTSKVADPTRNKSLTSCQKSIFSLSQSSVLHIRKSHCMVPLSHK